MAEKPPRGLADVVAASTALSDVDGSRPDSECIGESERSWIPLDAR